MVRLGLLFVSALLSLAAGVGLFSWVVRARLESRLVATARQQSVSNETFNVYYFGDSTMAGEPYQPQASIPRIVEYLLGQEVQGKPVRSLNLAQVGTGFGYSLERLREVLRNRRVSHPSLFVIYSGHNEFLKYHGRAARLLQAWPEDYSNLAARVDSLFTPLEIDERRFLDAGVVDTAQRQVVVERYRTELREALALMAASQVPVIVSTVAGNYADWEPNRSVFGADGRAAADFEGRVARGRALESRGELRAAVDAYQDALSLSDGFAEVHYRLGWCYRRLQEPTAAWDEFQRAVDADGMPIRATSAINDFIRNLGSGPLISTVDAVRRLRERSTDGLIGFDLMVDGHHPNLKGYILLSELIAREILRRFASGAQTIRSLDEAEALTLFDIDRKKLLEVAVSRGRWFTRLATWRYDPGDRLRRAEACFRAAMDMDPARYEPHLGLAMVQLLRGDQAGGEEKLAIARKLNAAEVDRYLEQPWVRRVRERAQRLAGASATDSPNRRRSTGTERRRSLRAG